MAVPSRTDPLGTAGGVGIAPGILTVPSSSITLLDWASGEGSAVVPTDIMAGYYFGDVNTYSDAISTTYQLTSDDKYVRQTPAAIVSAGCHRETGKSIFSVVSDATSASGNPIVAYTNMGYVVRNLESASWGGHFTGDYFITLRLRHSGMYSAAVTRGGESGSFYSIRSSAVEGNYTYTADNFPISFFGSVDSHGRPAHLSNTARLKAFKVNKSSPDGTVIVDIRPAMYAGIAGLYDSVSGKFYMEQLGQLKCCRNGRILSR